MRAGTELKTNPPPGTVFAVSSSVADALSQRITVLDSIDLAGVADHEQLHLTIGRTESKSSAMPSAIIITGPGFQDHDVVYSYYRLLEEGYSVDVATKDAAPVPGGSTF